MNTEGLAHIWSFNFSVFQLKFHSAHLPGGDTMSPCSFLFPARLWHLALFPVLRRSLWHFTSAGWFLSSSAGENWRPEKLSDFPALPVEVSRRARLQFTGESFPILVAAAQIFSSVPGLFTRTGECGCCWRMFWGLAVTVRKPTHH